MRLSEKELTACIHGLKKQDRQSQKQIFLQFYAYVKSITLRYSKSEQDSEELVNDIFIKVFFKINSFKPDGNFKAWLAQVAVNTCIDKYRQTIKLSHPQNLDEVTEGDVPFNQLEFDEKVELLPVIKELPESYRLVFNMFVFDEFSHKEIAKQLGISEGTSKSCLSRAKSIIRNHMIKQPEKYMFANG